MNIYSAFKYLAFKFDAEQIHDLTINLLSKAPHLSEFFSPVNLDPRLKLNIGELNWNSPIGLAAGFDKNAKCISFFEKVGFGSVEVGTITKLAQVGNPRPRIFRHPKIESVQNAMGFPNAGAEQIYQNIKSSNHNDLCLGINIGKNKDTNENDTPKEYAYLYEKFADLADYLVINISSPNTPGLRAFQKKDLLAPILKAVNEERQKNKKPVFIKIAPDLDDDDLKMICELTKEYNYSGIIATNTTIQHDFGKGGLSGRYIKEISANMRKKVCDILNESNDQIVIGVGGIDSFQDIKDFWLQGGAFVQIYTGFIFKGPQMLVDIQNELLAEFDKFGCKDLQEYYENISKFHNT